MGAINVCICTMVVWLHTVAIAMYICAVNVTTEAMNKT